MIAEERETTATFTDADTVVRIFTARRKDITAIERKGFTPVASGTVDSTRWAEYEIPVDRFKIATAIRPEKRVLSDDRRAELALRMKAIRGGA